MTTVAIALGHYLGAAVESRTGPRTDFRAAVALGAPESPPAFMRPVGIAAQRLILASLSPPDVSDDTPPPAATPALAAVVTGDDLHDDAGDPPQPPAVDPEHTGAIPMPRVRTAALDPVALPAAPAPAAPAVMLPRPKPKLAALTPAGRSTPDPEPPQPRWERTAIYDISARTVYLPNGEKLEAHSGLGRYMDDPAHVHRRNRGPTPPNIYRLSLREKLFHGVRAIRMTPEHEEKMFGRDGMLAHSYLLGPKGQSHGCVSIKDYPRFLRAYLRGEFDRLVVVSKLDRPPTFVARSRAPEASRL